MNRPQSPTELGSNPASPPASRFTRQVTSPCGSAFPLQRRANTGSDVAAAAPEEDLEQRTRMQDVGHRR